jgi:hypothetical protein
VIGYGGGVTLGVFGVLCLHDASDGFCGVGGQDGGIGMVIICAVAAVGVPTAVYLRERYLDSIEGVADEHGRHQMHYEHTHGGRHRRESRRPSSQVPGSADALRHHSPAWHRADIARRWHWQSLAWY